MTEIDDYYKAIGDRIDRNISDLGAVKNFDMVYQQWVAFAVIAMELVEDNQKALEAIKRLNIENDELAKLVEHLQEQNTTLATKLDPEIKRLKESGDLIKTASLQPKFEESKD
jgi:hypothetical protein